MTETDNESSSILQVLTWRDVKSAIQDVEEDEVRFLVDEYSRMQKQRMRCANQKRSLSKRGTTHSIIQWSQNQFKEIEETLRKALTYYIKLRGNEADKWALSIVGIGPVIAAGLRAHIDIHKAPTCGHIERYAGLDPKVRWEKGKKRPWNSNLKSLCWLIGESFSKFCNHEDQVYGSVYKARKELEQSLNEKKAFADQAAEQLRRFKIGKDTDAYKAYIQGFLPPAHIHARAKRYAVKRFLSHYHQVLFESTFNRPAPLPWIVAFGGHAHVVDPPNYTPLSRCTPRPNPGERLPKETNWELYQY